MVHQEGVRETGQPLEMQALGSNHAATLPKK